MATHATHDHKHQKNQDGAAFQPNFWAVLVPFILVLLGLAAMWQHESHIPIDTSDAAGPGVHARIGGAGSTSDVTPAVAEIPVILTGYSLAADGATANFGLKADDHAGADKTLFFKANLNSDGYVALLMSEAHQAPSPKFISGQLLGGIDELLQRQERTYGYRLADVRTDLRFCAIAAPSVESLTELVAEASVRWRRLPDAACVSVPGASIQNH